MGKFNHNRLIKEPFFLITQSFDYRFIDKNFLNKNFYMALSLKLRNGRGKEWQVDSNGSLYNKKDASLLKSDKEHIGKRKTVQIIKSLFVNNDGLFVDGDLHPFTDRLYEKFAEARTDKKLSNFIEKYDFCVFFDTNKNLDEENLDYEMKQIVPTESSTTRRLNWTTIHRKQKLFLEIAENFFQRKTTTADMDKLNEIIKDHTDENVYLNEKIFKFLSNVDIDDEEPTDEFFKEYLADELNLENRKVKMIYGHFALCCLELYLEIEKKLPKIKFCENPQCGKQLPLFRHWNQKVCKNNPNCHRQWKALKKQIERENLKRRRKTKKI
jgi:hypothetical protein